MALHGARQDGGLARDLWGVTSMTKTYTKNRSHSVSLLVKNHPPQLQIALVKERTQGENAIEIAGFLMETLHPNRLRAVFQPSTGDCGHVPISAEEAGISK